ncbi:MAG: acetyl-CoA synthetase, partial [Haloferacaceae archaeon]|nr:acetyl-CoA synthetase [Haloferacaceae archaeon]
PDESISEELNERVSRMHGPPFRPREILYVDALPKTQSGKILRRVMSKLYDDSDVGDLDSIQNPEAIDAIRKIV